MDSKEQILDLLTEIQKLVNNANHMDSKVQERQIHENLTNATGKLKTLRERIDQA